MTLKKLSAEDAYKALEGHEGWVVDRGEIYRDFRFSDFAAAIDFINAVATIAEDVNHHPNILLHEYCYVRISTYTHVADGITQRDIELVKRLDESLGDTQPLQEIKDA